MQAIALCLLLVGGPWGVYVSTFLQSMLCWGVIVTVYVDIRLRFAADDADELNCEEVCCEPETSLHFYHFLLAHLAREKKKNDRSGGSTSVLQIHLDDSEGPESPTKSGLRRLAGTLRKAIRGRVIIGRAGAQDLLAVLPLTNRKRAASVARALREELAGHNGRELPKISVATYPADGKTIGEVLAAANKRFKNRPKVDGSTE